MYTFFNSALQVMLVLVTRHFDLILYQMKILFFSAHTRQSTQSYQQEQRRRTQSDPAEHLPRSV